MTPQPEDINRSVAQRVIQAREEAGLQKCELAGTCENCGADLRYVFYIEHPDWGVIEVGTVCCDNLTGTTIASNLKRYETRKQRFVTSARWQNNTISQFGITVAIVRDVGSGQGGAFRRDRKAEHQRVAGRTPSLPPCWGRHPPTATPLHTIYPPGFCGTQRNYCFGVCSYACFGVSREVPRR